MKMIAAIAAAFLAFGVTSAATSAFVPLQAGPVAEAL